MTSPAKYILLYTVQQIFYVTFLTEGSWREELRGLQRHVANSVEWGSTQCRSSTHPHQPRLRCGEEGDEEEHRRRTCHACYNCPGHLSIVPPLPFRNMNLRNMNLCTDAWVVRALSRDLSGDLSGDFAGSFSPARLAGGGACNSGDNAKGRARRGWCRSCTAFPPFHVSFHLVGAWSQTIYVVFFFCDGPLPFA